MDKRKRPIVDFVYREFTSPEDFVSARGVDEEIKTKKYFQYLGSMLLVAAGYGAVDIGIHAAYEHLGFLGDVPDVVRWIAVLPLFFGVNVLAKVLFQREKVRAQWVRALGGFFAGAASVAVGLLSPSHRAVVFVVLASLRMLALASQPESEPGRPGPDFFRVFCWFGVFASLVACRFHD